MFDGRPLLTWVVDTCLESDLFDEIIVSTEDQYIADIAQKAGARVPFLRPAELAHDQSPIVPVVANAVSVLVEQGMSVDEVCLVYPTAVTLSAAHLVASHALLAEAPDDAYVVGIVRYPHPIQRALSRTDDGRLSMVDPATSQTRTQDLPDRWHDSGQFVWGRTGTWLKALPVLTNAVGFELPAWRTVDLDTEDDWLRAEMIHRLLRSGPLG